MDKLYVVTCTYTDGRSATYHPMTMLDLQAFLPIAFLNSSLANLTIKEK